MNKQEYLLTCLAEECAEVAQRCSKALRFGLDEAQPGNQDNRARLTFELIDLVAVVEMCAEEGILKPEVNSSEQMFEDKKAKVKKYMEYSRKQGCLFG